LFSVLFVKLQALTGPEAGCHGAVDRIVDEIALIQQRTSGMPWRTTTSSCPGLSAFNGRDRSATPFVPAASG
jgi:hypothetical protein